jgi:hypothetical protein
MAVMTYTRRQIVDMLPELLTKRLATFGPKGAAFEAEIGLSKDAVSVLNGMLTLREGDRLDRRLFAWRSPYAVKRPALDKGWAEVVAAGLAEPIPDGYRLSPRAIEVALETSRRVRAHLRSLDVPAAPLGRATRTLGHLAERIPATAERAARVRRLRPPADEPRSDMVDLSRAANELWAFRDDCHVGAWQAAGYEGPAFEVLSYVWSSPADVSWTKIGGNRTTLDLVKALAPRQDREDIERSVAALVTRGDLARDGDGVTITPQGQRSRDGIEAETDRRYFAIWDLDDPATSRLGDDLRAVIDALPKAAG